MPEGADSGRASRPAYGYGARILPAELHSKTENRELFWKEDAGDAKDFGKVMRPVLPHSAKEWNSENKRAKCCHVLPLLGIFFSPVCAEYIAINRAAAACRRIAQTGLSERSAVPFAPGSWGTVRGSGFCSGDHWGYTPRLKNFIAIFKKTQRVPPPQNLR